MGTGAVSLKQAERDPRTGSFLHLAGAQERTMEKRALSNEMDSNEESWTLADITDIRNLRQRPPVSSFRMMGASSQSPYL